MAERRYNLGLGRIRLVAVYLLVLGMVAFARPSPLGLAAGGLVAALGEAVRLWASGHLLKNRELVTSGPYRYVRNPLYLGRLLIFTGLCVMARLPLGANWLILLAGYAVFFGYYLPRKERVEPARLRELHRDAFDRYHRAVPALFPAGRPYRGGADSVWSGRRMLRNREHWMVVGLLAVVVFLVWRVYGASAAAVLLENR